MKTTREVEKVVVRFAGDSGDGIQLVGSEFTTNTALSGHDLETLPDFPAEIRAPAGTVPGVSGFQIQFSSKQVYTPGDDCQVLVVMNAAALKSNLQYLEKGGIIIANTDGFDKKNLRLAGYDKNENPLNSKVLEEYSLYEVPVTKLTRECLKGLSIGVKEKDRAKNMFVLGIIYWLYQREPDTSIDFIKQKFKHKPEIAEANNKALQAGYNFGDTAEMFTTRYRVKKATLRKGNYRSITGNAATAYGLVAAADKSGLPLFYGSYPITPASDILHELSKLKHFGVQTFQAEDEISAVSSAIGAAYGGQLAITGTSGPGLSLKAEAIGLAVSLELPLVICDVQRAGPSTGMPTKTEQADLFQALYGRHGESPLPVVAAAHPSDCFDAAFEACRIAVTYMTPVILLTDGYLANGSEPWQYPHPNDLPEIRPNLPKKEMAADFQAYQKDDKGARAWAIPGMKGFEHRVGGLEKEQITGNISYDPDNHENMVNERHDKIQNIAQDIAVQKVDNGPDEGEILLLGWGSTYGSLKTATEDLNHLGYKVSHLHLKMLNPLPRGIKEILQNFQTILVPEMNKGQLVQLIRSTFLVDAIPFNKVRGVPFSVKEIMDKVIDLYPQKKKD